jgi:gliding motility-associated-like protein
MALVQTTIYGIIIFKTAYHLFLHKQDDTEFCPREPFSIVIPNVLTPNQDGLNDIFKVSGTSYEFISMRIFNRWGQEIFSDFSGRGWDGRLPSGLKAKTGSYNFILQIQPLTRPVSNVAIYKGNIELFNN